MTYPFPGCFAENHQFIHVHITHRTSCFPVTVRYGVSLCHSRFDWRRSSRMRRRLKCAFAYVSLIVLGRPCAVPHDVKIQFLFAQPAALTRLSSCVAARLPCGRTRGCTAATAPACPASTRTTWTSWTTSLSTPRRATRPPWNRPRWRRVTTTPRNQVTTHTEQPPYRRYYLIVSYLRAIFFFNLFVDGCRWRNLGPTECTTSPGSVWLVVSGCPTSVITSAPVCLPLTGFVDLKQALHFCSCCCSFCPVPKTPPPKAFYFNSLQSGSYYWCVLFSIRVMWKTVFL